MCPVNALLDLRKNLEIKKGFLASLGRGASLEKYLRSITGNPTPVAPYALRIGGRTWYLSHGLDRQFVDILEPGPLPKLPRDTFEQDPQSS